MSDATPAWDNYWQGRGGDGAGALTGIEHDAELAAFWTNALQDADRSAPLLDLACGAGTVLRHASELGFADLTGADLSSAALAALTRALPGVKTVTCSAAATPFDDGAFATITSQFGFEYAGAEAAGAEIARLLQPGGQFIAVAHMAGGAIHTEVEGHHKACRTILESGYIDKSKFLFSEVFAGNIAAIAQAQTVMAEAREAVFGLTIPGRQSLASHLTKGAAQLWDNRDRYALADILGWFDGIEAQRAAFEQRMASMLDAALDETGVGSLQAVFKAAGLETTPEMRLQLGGEDAAWVLKAARPA